MSTRNFGFENGNQFGHGFATEVHRASPASGIAHCKSPRILPSRVARAPFTDNSFSSRPRSASMVTSLSVTSILPFIAERKNPIFAANEKKRVEPCQLLCSFVICSGRLLIPPTRSSKDRSTARITSSLDLLCETVTRTRYITPFASLGRFTCTRSSPPRSRTRENEDIWMQSGNRRHHPRRKPTLTPLSSWKSKHAKNEQRRTTSPTLSHDLWGVSRSLLSTCFGSESGSSSTQACLDLPGSSIHIHSHYSACWYP